MKNYAEAIEAKKRAEQLKKIGNSKISNMDEAMNVLCGFTKISEYEEAARINKELSAFAKSHPYIVWNVKTGQHIEYFERIEDAEKFAAQNVDYRIYDDTITELSES